MNPFKPGFGDRQAKLSVSEIIGASIIGFGILILISIGVYELFGNADNPSISSFMAIGFFLIMLGFAFYFPDMLRSATHDTTSSMRVVVYMIVAVFVFLCVKIGWNCKSLSDFKMDRTWAYILAAAIGGKAVQSFGENMPLKNPLAFATAGPSSNTGPNAGSRTPASNTRIGSGFPTDPAPDGPPGFIVNQNQDI